MNHTGAGLLPLLNWGDPLDRDGDFVLPVGTVTFLLADVEGSTRGWEGDPSAMADAMARMSSEVSELIAAHGGVRPLEQGEGDSFVAAFARASDAVACALAIQQHLDSGPLRLRIGVHSGEAHHGTDKTYVGPTVNRTARIRDAGHGGQVLVSDAAAQLVADRLPVDASLLDLGLHRLKDLARAERIHQLLHPALATDFPPLRTLDSYRHNLPVQRTPLFGRTDESRALLSLLEKEAIVTLHGGGGCGKTRLAVHVAAQMLDRFPDGVFLVDLSALRDGAAIGRAVLDALGLVREQERALMPYLRGKTMLVVLDNCEHLIAQAAELAEEMTAACSSVRILATSREPLGIDGEVTFRVPSLPTPPAGTPLRLDGLAPFAAAELFLDRARRVRPDFEPSPDDAAAIADICRRLDGVPLAIELAASRVRSMSTTDIAAGLDERFGLLTGGGRTRMPRQQTLQASVDWSYDLLIEAERVVFRRLSVFAGSFTLDAARDIASGAGVAPHQVVDLVALLIDKSLVVPNVADGPTRYRMLETIRQYAHQRLQDSGELATVRKRHCDFFVAEAERRQRAVLSRDYLDFSLDNAKAAYQWALEVDDAQAMAVLACTLITHEIMLWRLGARFDEVTARLDRVLAATRALYCSLLAYLGHMTEQATAFMPADQSWCDTHGLAGRAALVEVTLMRMRWGTASERVDLEQLERTLDIARRADDVLAEVLITLTLMIAVEYIAEDVDPAPYWERVFERFADDEDLLQLWSANRAGDLTNKGDYREALTHLERIEFLAGAGRADVLLRRAAGLLAGGNVEAASEHIIGALSVADEFGALNQRGAALARRAHVHLARDELAAAVDDYRGGVDAITSSGDWYSTPLLVRARAASS